MSHVRLRYIDILGRHQVTFVIRFEGIRVLLQDGIRNYKHFARGLLNRQIDVIYGIHERSEDFTLELRYLFADTFHQLEIYFMVRTKGAERKEAMVKAEELEKYLLRLLAVNNSYHEFAQWPPPRAGGSA